ncbi:ATP-binding protein [Litoreibacter roseus]|uniref:Histidine kinase/HSP90-like ATPase domain-containing protein n=1 Tax=Litoreibacter roseus TaxID=2601869 RepID=A0A6N6JK97_9RHOB|nr:ATP-binding protein [Litoreibacter roseus]GFE66280.1 hypothetical protein KIN_33540 [Litoreibacter roseus]
MTQLPPDLPDGTHLDLLTKTPTFSLSGTANFATIREMVQTLCERVEPLVGSTPSPRIELELVTAEVLTNIVRHGYRDISGGMIELSAYVSDNDVTILTLDRGHPMPGLAVPEPKTTRVDVPLYDLPEGGFGWSLIHQMTSRCDYRRYNDANYLIYTIARSDAER